MLESSEVGASPIPGTPKSTIPLQVKRLRMEKCRQFSLHLWFNKSAQHTTNNNSLKGILWGAPGLFSKFLYGVFLSLTFLFSRWSITLNSKIGMQIVSYSFRIVVGWRQPKRAPTAFSEKKALLPREIISFFLQKQLILGYVYTGLHLPL